MDHDVILGEILIARIRSNGESLTVDSPTTVMRMCGLEHVIDHARYASVVEAFQAAQKLVPESCRHALKLMPATKVKT